MKREAEEEAGRKAEEEAGRKAEEERRKERDEQARQKKDADEDKKPREETKGEPRERSGQSQSHSTRTTHPESIREDKATRGIKHAWSWYASFAERFRKHHDRRLTFTDITWPVYPSISNINSITHTNVAQFLFSSHHSVALPRKVRLRVALVRWHPDKFEAQWMGRVVERDKKKVKEGVESVTRALLRLKKEDCL
jgi:hypothetical protein